MKNFIIKQLEAGKKIKGLSGYTAVRPTVECGKGSSGQVYVPVTIEKMVSEECGSIKLIIKFGVDHYIEEKSDTFEISPASFYKSIEEIKEVKKHRKNISDYNETISKISSRGYGSRLASHRRDSLLDLYNCSTEEAKAIIDAELVEKGTTLKKIGQEWFDQFAKILAKPLYFPNAKPDEDIDESEDWED